MTNYLLNAEGLPVESIDKIEITLNPVLAPFIDWKNRSKIDKYLNVRYTNYYGLHYYLDIQAQFIYKYPDVKLTMANAVSELMDKGFISFNLSIPVIYNYLHYFIHEVREIEFAFDFRPEALAITHPEKLIRHKNSVYTADRRTYTGKSPRKSLAKKYDHNESLKSFRKTPLEKINANPYSQRIEFCLSKYNCPYRTINNMSGRPADVIQRYIPYLAAIYHRHLYGNIIVNTDGHPFFSMIYLLAENSRSRYTGNLEKTVPHSPSKQESAFFRLLAMKNLICPDISLDVLACFALAGR